MKENAERPLYDPPRAIDLSSIGVNGLSGIDSICSTGQGASTQSCKPVGMVAHNKCDLGSYYNIGCGPGSAYLYCLTGGSKR